MSQFEVKDISEWERRLGIPGSSSSHFKLQGLQENQKLIPHYLECSTIVLGLYKMFLSNQDPCWRAAFLAASYSNYSPCSFTPAHCWPSDLPRQNNTCLKRTYQIILKKCCHLIYKDRSGGSDRGKKKSFFSKHFQSPVESDLETLNTLCWVQITPLVEKLVVWVFFPSFMGASFPHSRLFIFAIEFVDVLGVQSLLL